jgi:hypothetical protein
VSGCSALTEGNETELALAIERRDPHPGLPPLAQAFHIALGDGGPGLAWVSFRDAIRVGAFGRAWIAAALITRAGTLGCEDTLRALVAPGGLRLGEQRPSSRRPAGTEPRTGPRHPRRDPVRSRVPFVEEQRVA